jgi:glycosyltransferase involved in cell wall biosynthesis
MVESKEDDAPRVRWREALKAVIVRQYDAALVGGTPHRDYLQKLGLRDDFIFDGYDVVDNAYFAEAVTKAREHPEQHSHLPGLAGGSPYFLVASRFIPRKNLDRLLTAYGQYRRQSAHPWRLLILGDGRLRHDLEERVARERIEQVIFAGLRPYEEVSAYYAYAEALIHPASKDQWGLVVNEAMAAGLPVIVSTGAGCAGDLVHPPHNGYLFEPTDVTGLIDAMQRMSSRHTDRGAMGTRSKDIIRDWTPERFARGLYDAAICGSRSSRRGLKILPRVLLWLMLKASRSAESYATVEA